MSPTYPVQTYETQWQQDTRQPTVGGSGTVIRRLPTPEQLCVRAAHAQKKLVGMREKHSSVLFASPHSTVDGQSVIFFYYFVTKGK